MGVGMIITAVAPNGMPWKEAPKRGQVSLTADQVRRLFGEPGIATAGQAPDFGGMGGQFAQLSLRAWVSEAVVTDPEDREIVEKLRKMSEQDTGKGIVSIRPLRI